mmetsp:Transcript_105226/g.329542  ORF Transcript_105226/g.329542 Transcript_105226/m.329542 type:complete len:84 (-) Transcript_105226:251-502(-)
MHATARTDLVVQTVHVGVPGMCLRGWISPDGGLATHLSQTLSWKWIHHHPTTAEPHFGSWSTMHTSSGSLCGKWSTKFKTTCR